MDVLIKNKIEMLAGMTNKAKVQEVYDMIFFKIQRKCDESVYGTNDNGAFIQLNKLSKKVLKDLNAYLDVSLENLTKEEQDTVIDLDELETFYEKKKKKTVNTVKEIKYPKKRTINIPTIEVGIVRAKPVGLHAEILRNLRRFYKNQNALMMENSSKNNEYDDTEAVKKEDEADEEEDEVDEESEKESEGESDEEEDAESEEEVLEEDDGVEDDGDDVDGELVSECDIDDIDVDEQAKGRRKKDENQNAKNYCLLFDIGFSYSTFEDDCEIIL